MRTITLENGNKVKLSEESYKALADSIKPQLWRPSRTGDHYWYIDSDGDILTSLWDGGSLDNDRLAQGNVFASEKQAEFVKRNNNTVLTNVMLTWRFDNDNVSFDWSKKTEKYCLWFNHLSGTWYTMSDQHTQNEGSVYFSSRKKAKDCVKYLVERGVHINGQ